MTNANCSTKTRPVSIGDIFGRLEVLEYIGVKGEGKRSTRLWKCQCSCGNVISMKLAKEGNAYKTIV